MTLARHAQLRAEMVEIGRRLYARGLIAASEGNLSVREADTLLVTPSGVCKGFLSPEAIGTTNLEGRPLDGSRVSSETLMHVAVYRQRPDVCGIVHAHPPTATGFAAAGIALDRPLIAEAVVSLGQVPVIPYGTPSTQQLAENVASSIGDAQGVLLANHGALSVGETLTQAWERMEILEQLARVALTTHLLGRDELLGEADVSQLEAMRAAAASPPRGCEGCPSRDIPQADRVVLSRAELVRLVTDAVRRFGGA